MGEFSEEQHPRATDGKFTEGEAGEPGKTASARSASSKAIKQGQNADATRPKLEAEGQTHSNHADKLRGVAKAHVEAAKAHNEAAGKAIENGDHDRGKQHADAALTHLKEARERNHEANEHATLGKVNRQEHSEHSAEVAKDAHAAGKEASGHHDKAGAGKEHGKDHEKPGEREEHKGGIGEWVVKKLEGAKETIHEKGEEARELGEKAIEGDPYEAAKEIAEAGGGAAASLLKKKKEHGEHEGKHEE